MTVITPILDTLLHEVLGRRTAAPALRSLNETVTPVWPAGMLNPGHEDTVLDMRRIGVSERALAQTGAQPANKAAPEHGESLPGGVQARLSPVAKVIAGILGRFPAPASTLRILAPLIQEQASVPSALVATQLQSSVNDSGLFYEAHLARWYRGVLPLAQLAGEPQMQLPGAVRVPVGISPGTDTSGPGQVAPGHVVDMPSAFRAAPESNEALQGLLRHQLELLSVPIPVLRWEGEVWAGIFMQLMIQLPEFAGHAEQDADDKDNEACDVESEATINLQSLGLLKVKLHLHGERLGLMLGTESLHCLQHLEAGREALATRLRNCGFSAPGIQIKMLEEGGHD